MVGRGMRWIAWTCLAWLPIGCAFAGDPCTTAFDTASSYPARIAAIACAENRLWYGPFIDADGRLASITVAESEDIRLQDGVTPAWRRVVDYWSGSGLLWQMSMHAGADACSVPQPVPLQRAACRAFVIDTPWSAAFVSFVMARAGLPGFPPSASHADFVRGARNEAANPYRLVDPEQEPPATGDLLCFARSPATLGFRGLQDFLKHAPDAGLAMHCDIVVGANTGGDGRLHLVGGNVLQGVTARVLNLNRNGMLWGLPRRMAAAACSPDDASACSFNRQDWVALLKLKALPAPAAPLPAAPVPVPEACCVQCALPMPPGMQRCPAPPDR